MPDGTCTGNWVVANTQMGFTNQAVCIDTVTDSKCTNTGRCDTSVMGECSAVANTWPAKPICTSLALRNCDGINNNFNWIAYSSTAGIKCQGRDLADSCTHDIFCTGTLECNLALYRSPGPAWIGAAPTVDVTFKGSTQATDSSLQGTFYTTSVNFNIDVVLPTATCGTVRFDLLFTKVDGTSLSTLSLFDQTRTTVNTILNPASVSNGDSIMLKVTGYLSLNRTKYDTSNPKYFALTQNGMVLPSKNLGGALVVLDQTPPTIGTLFIGTSSSTPQAFFNSLSTLSINWGNEVDHESNLDRIEFDVLVNGASILLASTRKRFFPSLDPTTSTSFPFSSQPVLTSVTLTKTVFNRAQQSVSTTQTIVLDDRSPTLPVNSHFYIVHPNLGTALQVPSYIQGFSSMRLTLIGSSFVSSTPVNLLCSLQSGGLLGNSWVGFFGPSCTLGSDGTIPLGPLPLGEGQWVRVGVQGVNAFGAGSDWTYTAPVFLSSAQPTMGGLFIQSSSSSSTSTLDAIHSDFILQGSNLVSKSFIPPVGELSQISYQSFNTSLDVDWSDYTSLSANGVVRWADRYEPQPLGAFILTLLDKQPSADTFSPVGQELTILANSNLTRHLKLTDSNTRFGTLKHNHQYAVAMKARSLSGVDSGSVTSAAVTIDLTPPTGLFVRSCQIDPDFETLAVLYPRNLSVSFGNAVDPESSVVSFQACVGRPGSGSISDAMACKDVGLASQVFFNPLHFVGNISANQYFLITVIAFNGAGLYQQQTTPPVLWSSFTSVSGTVSDGPLQGVDIDYQSNKTTLWASWSLLRVVIGSTSEAANSYAIAAGTSENSQLLQAFRTVTVGSKGGSYVFNNLKLVSDQSYVVTIQITSPSGGSITSQLQSNGVRVIDYLPDTRNAVVYDGPTLGVDIDFTNTTLLSATWTGFDSGAPLSYSMEIQSIADVVGLSSRSISSRVQVGEGVLAGSISLPTGYTQGLYRILVCASNPAGATRGESCAYSNGIMVDASLPSVGWVNNGAVPQQHQAGQASLTDIAINWVSRTQKGKVCVGSYSVLFRRAHTSYRCDGTSCCIVLAYIRTVSPLSAASVPSLGVFPPLLPFPTP
jgi:hypothetical protein